MTSHRRPDEGWKLRANLWIAGLLGFSFLGIPLVVYRPVVGGAIYAIALLGMAAALFRWHDRNTDFRCAGCGTVFGIRLRTLVWSLNFGRKKLLRCPSCNRHDWCLAVPKATSRP